MHIFANPVTYITQGVFLALTLVFGEIRLFCTWHYPNHSRGERAWRKMALCIPAFHWHPLWGLLQVNDKYVASTYL